MEITLEPNRPIWNQEAEGRGVPLETKSQLQFNSAISDSSMGFKLCGIRGPEYWRSQVPDRGTQIGVVQNVEDVNGERQIVRVSTYTSLADLSVTSSSPSSPGCTVSPLSGLAFRGRAKTKNPADPQIDQ